MSRCILLPPCRNESSTDNRPSVRGTLACIMRWYELEIHLQYDKHTPNDATWGLDRINRKLDGNPGMPLPAGLVDSLTNLVHL